MDDLIGKSLTEAQEILKGYYHFGFVFNQSHLTSWGESVWKIQKPDGNLAYLIVNENHYITRIVPV